MISPEELVGRFTLILGDLKAGKTRLTAELLKDLGRRFPGDVAVLDLAPPMIQEIGGRLTLPEGLKVDYFVADVVAPHPSAGSPGEVLELARRNREAIETIFGEYSRSPKRVLVINDVSIYLQGGSLEPLLSLLEESETVLMNGYYGGSFPGCPLAEVERERVEELADRCHRVIHL